jgi:F-type H+-transporting ATPase subunit a
METLSVLFSIGPFGITRTVVTTWGIMLVLGLGSWLGTRRLSVERPGLLQSAVEGAVQALKRPSPWSCPSVPDVLLPFVGTLWLFIAVANLTGLIPGLHAPTGDLSTTAALAILVFLSVHWYGIRSAGLASTCATTSPPARSCCPSICSANCRAPWRLPCACSATS